MIYDVILHIANRYSSPAIGGRHLARLMPADLPGEQRLIAAHLDIRPHPAERTDRSDFFGNRATDFAFRGATDEVVLHLQARIERHGPASPVPSTPLADLPAELVAIHESRRILTGPFPRPFAARAAATRPLPPMRGPPPPGAERSERPSPPWAKRSTATCATIPRQPRWTHRWPRPLPSGTASARTSATS